MNELKVNEITELLKSETVREQDYILSIFKAWFYTGVILKQISLQ